MPKPKLELTWIGKETRPRLEPRILIEDPDKSYHAKYRIRKSTTEITEDTEREKGKTTPSSGDLFDNKLIFGDNLLALKALEAEYSGKVKCVFIDPPYNTGSAFTHYDDGVEHSIWLGLMRDRLEIIKRLMSEDGSLWITIDDNECHYLKVMLDEIFGRPNFVANGIWHKAYSVRMDSKGFSFDHDHVLVYQKSEQFIVRKLEIEQSDSQFSNFDEKKQKYYRRRSLRKEGSNSLRSDRPNLYYALIAPDGSELFPIKPDGTEGYWRWSSETYRDELEKDPDILEWIRRDNSWQVYVKQFKEENPMRPPSTVWDSTLVGHNHEAKEEAKSFNREDVFSTPKPERLIQFVLKISTNPGDLVLDSFAGSGTTGAVAHKMGRRWIMVELGEHCHTHIIPRLKKVIDGEDPGGITEAVGWKGGGGFRYYRLAPSLLEKDKWGNWIINKDYNAAMLAEALCKLEGFTYAPSETEYFIHGHSTETDFIWVTTQNLGHEQLAALSEDVGANRSLLVLCSAYRATVHQFPNLTVKKIPNAVLSRCEWGHDDYSLQVENLPSAPKPKAEQPDLFGGEG